MKKKNRETQPKIPINLKNLIKEIWEENFRHYSVIFLRKGK